MKAWLTIFALASMVTTAAAQAPSQVHQASPANKSA